MKVSVIIATYNQAKTIERAICSVMRQNYSDYEIIIVNDGSTDNTAEIIEMYSTDAKIINLEHKGIMNTYATAFKNCNGEYIALCDGDDYWIHRDRLVRQVHYMDFFKDCGLCLTKVYTEIDGIRYPMTATTSFINDNMSFDSLLKGNAHIHAQSYLIRKSDFDKYIDFDSFDFYTWDYPIILELINHVRFHTLDFYSAVFVKNTESTTQTRNRKRRLRQIIGVFKIKLHYIKKYNCKISTKLYLFYIFARRIYSLIFKRWT